MNVNHKTVALKTPHGDKVDIDEGLAGIIRYLWTHGVETQQCCEDDAWLDSAWIHFGSVNDMTAFINLLYPEGEDNPEEYPDFVQRGSNWEVWTPELSQSRLAWRWKVAPTYDDELEVWVLGAAVEFPVSDIPAVKEALGII